MIKRRIFRNYVSLFLLAALLTLTGCGSNSSKEPSTPAAATGSRAYKVTVRVDPDPPAGGKENSVHVSLQDAAGKPISDAQIHMTFTMPAMPEVKMPEMRNSADLPWTGSEYSGPFQIMMAGGWNIEVEAKRGSDVLTTYKTQLTAH